jgi:hypothetical protein
MTDAKIAGAACVAHVILLTALAAICRGVDGTPRSATRFSPARGKCVAMRVSGNPRLGQRCRDRSKNFRSICEWQQIQAFPLT